MEVEKITALHWEYLLLALLGIIMHVLIKVLNRSNKSQPISFKLFIANKTNRLRVALSIVSVIVILMLADDIADIMQVKLSDGSPARRFLAFLAGYLNHSLVRDLLKVFKRRNDSKS